MCVRRSQAVESSHQSSQFCRRTAIKSSLIPAEHHNDLDQNTLAQKKNKGRRQRQQTSGLQRHLPPAGASGKPLLLPLPRCPQQSLELAAD